MRFFDLFGTGLRGFYIRSDKVEDINNMILESKLRHPLAGGRARARELDPFFDDGGMVLPNEVG
jgi:hypothetical protein